MNLKKKSCMVVLKCHLKLRFTQIIPSFLPSQPPLGGIIAVASESAQIPASGSVSEFKLDKLLQAVFPPQVAK